MREWRRRRRCSGRHECCPGPLAPTLGALASGLVGAGGPLGRLLRAGSAARPRKLKIGESPDKVFPVPLLRGGESSTSSSATSELPDRVLANVILVILNWMYAGCEELAHAGSVPTAAQRRVQDNVRTAAREFVRCGVPWPSDSEISDVLRYSDLYEGRGVWRFGPRGPEAAFRHKQWMWILLPP